MSKGQSRPIKMKSNSDKYLYTELDKKITIDDLMLLVMSEINPVIFMKKLNLPSESFE